MVNEWTNFGFEKILKTDKVKKVMDVFNGVSNVYDLMNDVMSLGIHRLWKKEFVKKFEYKDNMQIIDVGGGTADITKLVLDNSFEKKFYNNNGWEWWRNWKGIKLQEIRKKLND